jgi:hypothetical protein
VRRGGSLWTGWERSNAIRSRGIMHLAGGKRKLGRAMLRAWPTGDACG